MELRRYLTADGIDVFHEWFSSLRDKRAKVSISRRLDRAQFGNFGHVRPLRQGVWEMKIDVGQGYRVYYAQAGQTIILLLCGGDKGTQSTDIERAVGYWKDFQNRNRG